MPAVKTSQTAKATAKGGQGSGKGGGGKGSQNKVYVRPSSGAGSPPTASVPSRAPKSGQWKTWSRAKGAQSLHSSVRGASSKKASAPQAAQRMFVKLLAQRRRQTHGKFAKSSRGNQLVRVSSAVEEARKAGIQKAGKQSLQWVRHEVLTAHAENVKVHAENVKARTDKKQKQIVSVGGGMYRRSKGGLTLVRVEDPAAAGSGTGASNSQVNADAKAKPSHKASRTVIGGSTYVSKGSTMVRVTGKTSALKARSTRKCLQMILSLIHI